MKKRIIRYVKHILGTVLFLLLVGTVTLVSLNGTFNYNNNPKGLDLDKEGPYVFFDSDSSLNVNYIRGNKTDGFFLERSEHQLADTVTASCYFPLDESSFDVILDPSFETPKSTYNDGEAILAISDIESGFKTFRDYLINNSVIDSKLNWTFGKGHLVLVGDFVDRGKSTTQVLWFIYKLEQEAKKHGGKVHFIIGNHELYNLQGKYKSASYKYYGVSAILGKQHHHLYDDQSFIGRWMASKNTIELINGNLFTHGGLHPELANHDITIEELNQINRDNYRKPYFPKPDKAVDQLVLSKRKGICWYRGYFEEDLTQEQVEKGIEKFNAKAIIVGHTPQWTIKSLFNKKVFAIDVKHPKDYINNWPNKKSEGLLIKDDKYIRLLMNQKTFEL